MKNLIVKCAAFCLLTFFIFSCSEDEPENRSFNLNISGLEDLGMDFAYEGWLIIDGNAISTGVFSVNQNGEMSSNSFSVSEDDLSNASTFVLTIEPSPDPDPDPSDIHLLAGDFINDVAQLRIDHAAALNDDFSSSNGNYILATPTNGSENNEKSGIWWLDPSSGTPMPGLELPGLPSGWQYEGWVVIGGTPITTGTFSGVSSEDNGAPYSGTMPGPPFPGEDFIVNAPFDLSFPTDISGDLAVISIEPVPDNSPNPFLLKPLVGQIPADALDHTVYTMDTNLNFPTGSVTR